MQNYRWKIYIYIFFGKIPDVSAKTWRRTFRQKNMPKRLRLKTFAETIRMICEAYPVYGIIGRRNYRNNTKHKMCLGYVPISSSAQRPLGAAYIPILLSEVEQEQRPSGNGDREAIVVGAGFCDGEGESAYTGYAPHMGGRK